MEWDGFQQDNNKIKITEKNTSWFSSANNNEELVVYVPNNITFENVVIEAGAGQVNIEELNANNLTLKLGAGKVQVNNLTVTNKTKIDGGAGKLDIIDAKLNNLDFDMGVGETTIVGMISGNSKIEAGIGALNLNLKDKLEDYKIKANKGLGSITIGERKIDNGETIGSGDNYIEIDGGIGSIKIY